MEYNEFEKTLLSQLKNNDDECIKNIENNKKLIQLNLQNREKPIHIHSFLNHLNDIILDNKKSFKLIEKVLKHELFNSVLSEFKESNIMINACKVENIPAIQWLMTMDINPYVQDENGMTFLMHAVEHSKLKFLVKEVLKNNDVDEEYLHLTDKNGETALFHAVNNPDILEKLIYSNIDINCQNHNKESVLLYCCKNDMEEAINTLISKSSMIDYDVIDKEGRTIPMYLIIKNYFDMLCIVLRKKNFNINYHNKNNNESFVSLLINKYQEIFMDKTLSQYNSKDIDKISLFANVISLTYSYPNCDLNIPIDEDGNTPIMFFMMVKDYVTTSFILSDYENIDLSIKNKHGINASLLSVLIDKNEISLIKAFLEHKTFDSQCTDSLNNNILIYSVLNNNPSIFTKLVDEKSINHLNNGKENAVIIATKLGFLEEISSYSIHDVNINQQDHLGNTAIYYAIKIKDKYAINLLAYNKADIHIKNDNGVSAFDLAQDLNEKDILKILDKPISARDMKKKLSGGKKSFFKKKDKDEKLNEYIKNYQINNYQEVYNTIINKILNYPEIEYSNVINEKLVISYYYNIKRTSYIPLKCIDIQAIVDRKQRMG